MKIDEIERLAVAATTAELRLRAVSELSDLPGRVKQWRQMYHLVLAEFIEQEKAERAATPKD